MVLPPADSDDEWLDELLNVSWKAGPSLASGERHVEKDASHRELDSDEEWIADLTGAKHRQNNDVGLHDWMAELLSSQGQRQQGAEIVSAAAAVCGTKSCDQAREGDIARSSTQPNVGTSTQRSVISSSSNRKRRITHPKELDIDDLVHQHGQTMIEASFVPIIDVALVRSWLSANPSDYLESALVGLGESLADRVLSIVEDIPPRIFKIGLTRSPVWRFIHAPGFAYYPAEFNHMTVLAVSCSKVIQFLEKWLINKFAGRPGCRNVASGGESAPPDSIVCYLYLVHIHAEAFAALRLRVARRRIGAL